MTDRKEHRKHLYYLHELSDFKVDSDDPDVRGWKVKDADDRVIGKVDNLLVSKEKKRVVYLDVEVDKSIIDANHDPYGKSASGDVHEFINRDGENHLILPIGLARLNIDDKYVYTDRINYQTFAETKRMEKGYDVDRDYEIVVLESYNRDLDDDHRREDSYRSGVAGDQNKNLHKDRTGRTGDYDERRESLTDHERTDRDRNLTDRDKNLTDRDRDLTDRDRDLTDRDRNQAGRGDNLLNKDRSGSRDSGTYDDDRRKGDRYADDDSFYDRGEFDRTRYRNDR